MLKSRKNKYPKNGDPINLSELFLAIWLIVKDFDIKQKAYFA